MHGFHPAAFTLLLLVGFPGGSSPQLQEPYRISVNVDLVVLNTTVRDRKGQFASDLRQEDFEIYEDGVRQSIRLFRHEDIPVTVGLVIDHSGSMSRKMPSVIAAARTFVRASNQEDQMFVVNFNEHVSAGLPVAVPFSNRVEELESAILRTPTAGQTALYDALDYAQDRLRAGKHDKKVLVVISDGADNASRHSLEEVLKVAGQSTALIYTIGIFDEDDQDSNPRVLKKLAQATGGEAFISGERTEVTDACERIARDIRHQYTIGYVPVSAPPPGAYRSIRVVARGTGARRFAVRARAGYVAGEGAK